MNARSNSVTGYVAGGLGNQLFILAAAWNQARRLGAPLLLDCSHFAAPGTRSYGLSELDVPATVLKPRDSWRAIRINAERLFPVPTRPSRIFLERNPDTYQPAIERITRGTTLVGYFQSPRYFPRVHDELMTAIWATPETDGETAALREMAARPAITLHLRRGDYLAVPKERQFIATVDYARRALELLRSLGVDLPVRVFSDSVSLVREELSTTPGDFEFVEDDDTLGTWATLKAMATGEAIIMSNSSYSWWAAELVRHRRGAATYVVGPRPWTLGGTAKADLLRPEWITLDAR